MDNNNAENHNWRHLGVEPTTDLLNTIPALGCDGNVPLFIHGRYVDRFWYDGEINNRCAIFYIAASEIMEVVLELEMLLLSVEDGKVIGLHFPTID